MKNQMSSTDIKRTELMILDYIDHVCKEHGLRYMLCGGTLLGAIRHRGFIPWDDDIDISMPRPDYLRLIELFREDDRYQMLSLYNTEGYYYPFAKIVDNQTRVAERDIYFRQIEGMGVYVDVFPLDGLPQGDKEILRHMNQLERDKLMLHLSLCRKVPRATTLGKKLFKPLVMAYAKATGYRYWLSCVEKMATRYPYEQGDHTGSVIAQYGRREIMPREVFDTTIQVPFEEKMYPAPAGYDRYLTSLYGDYMQLPPEEKRRFPHRFHAAHIGCGETK